VLPALQREGSPLTGSSRLCRTGRECRYIKADGFADAVLQIRVGDGNRRRFELAEWPRLAAARVAAGRGESLPHRLLETGDLVVAEEGKV